MIWADRVALVLSVLVAFVFGIAFVSSDAALRMASLRAREAKLDAACAQQTAPVVADALAPARTDAAPDGAVAETTAPISKADASSQPEAAAEVPREVPSDVAASPARFCFDDKVRSELESEEADITVPTARGTAIEIAEAEAFGVVPIWVALRVFDIKSGGPRRRLARSAYWRATEDARRARRRQRRERTERVEAGER